MNVYELGDKHLETLAESAHNTWVETMEENGYHHPSQCPVKLNNAKYQEMLQTIGKEVNLEGSKSCYYCHPDMVPYAKADEYQKDKMRNVCLGVLDCIRTIEGAK